METDLSTIKRCIYHLIKEFDYQTKELRDKPLKELVSLIRQEKEGVMPAFVDGLFEHLRRDDCDVRLGALFIANHFFQRSHNFRLELLNSLQDFLVYTLGTSPVRYPLPSKPAEAVELLKRETLAMLHCWTEKFSAGYEKLEKLKHFLQHSKCVNWADSQGELMIEREREAQMRFQQEIKARKVVEHVTKLYEESHVEIERLLTESHNIIEIVFPKFCPLEINEERQLESSSSSQIRKEQLHGFAQQSVGITISINEIKQTSENEDLLNQLNDTTKLLEKWHSRIGNWLKKLAEIGDSSALMRRLIDFKNTLHEDLQKCLELRVKRRKENEEISDESDFEDVEEKEGYEPEFHNQDEKLQQKTNLLKEQPGPSSPCKIRETATLYENKKQNLVGKGCVPTLAMGLDLKYWGQSNIKPAERARSCIDGHQFWRPIEEDNVPTEDMEAYRARQITFIGTMPPLRKRCRARLPSGKLCPRMERGKCALHGVIIDRDEMGFPQQPHKSEEERLLGEQNADSEKERKEEMEYLRDVEAATGAKLTVTTKKKAVRRKKGTTKKKKRRKKGTKTARKRIKPKSVKMRERLVAKLFDKRTLRRVTKTLEQMQKARSKSKFSNQFNYALERK